MSNEPGSPGTWMLYARSDLALARRADTPGVLRESLCFHAQQAAEKSIKAVLVFRDRTFPKTHSIQRLTELLPPDIERTPELLESQVLTPYAATFRYPGREEAVTEEDYRRLLRLATAVVAWAEAIISL